MLLYVLVARGNVVLAEFTSSSGNFSTVTRSLLKKIPSHDDSLTIAYDEHCFHYVVSDEIVFMCMAEEGSKRRIPFAFLHDIRSRWHASYGDAGQTADAFAMQDEFGGLMRTQMDYFNELNHDSVRRVESQLDEVKEVMVKSIAKVLDRGDRITLMVDKTDELSAHSHRFQNNVCRRSRCPPLTVRALRF
jgi:vesicle-associated membrane protein 7